MIVKFSLDDNLIHVQFSANGQNILVHVGVTIMHEAGLISTLNYKLSGSIWCRVFVRKTPVEKQRENHEIVATFGMQFKILSG